MKQILVLSGKGGTGKTTVSSSFVKLAAARAFADCDVDAPNLQLLFGADATCQRDTYEGFPKAIINTRTCIGCTLCGNTCRFGAITISGGTAHVDPYACEGCRVCAYVCPNNAISFEPFELGDLALYSGNVGTSADDGVFSTAELRIGAGATGKLVTQVKNRMRDNAPANADIAVLDGCPGIGCPVIASVGGVDLVLLVAEPSISGMSDMERIVATVKPFRTKMALCVNKADIDPERAEACKRFAEDNDVAFVGSIPFDNKAAEAINAGKPVVDYDCPAGSAIRDIYAKTVELLEA